MLWLRAVNSLMVDEALLKGAIHRRQTSLTRMPKQLIRRKIVLAISKAWIIPPTKCHSATPLRNSITRFIMPSHSLSARHRASSIRRSSRYRRQASGCSEADAPESQPNRKSGLLWDKTSALKESWKKSTVRTKSAKEVPIPTPAEEPILHPSSAPSTSRSRAWGSLIHPSQRLTCRSPQSARAKTTPNFSRRTATSCGPASGWWANSIETSSIREWRERKFRGITSVTCKSSQTDTSAASSQSCQTSSWKLTYIRRWPSWRSRTDFSTAATPASSCWQSSPSIARIKTLVAIPRAILT